MFGIITAEGKLTYCNAGHNPPLVVGPSGLRRLEDGGPVVGLLEFAPYSQGEIPLVAGDTVIVYSDGVSEAMNSAGDEFGEDRVQQVTLSGAALSAQAVVERIVAAVREFTRGAPQSDDITAMAVRFLGS
jgi:sigma-B regulation protein RsbU (phosphoserine phosphatase)